mmetsp:Transcript_72512/g.206485  ORF Transcript_72512/g.206485 Transcript_72512/m.206485 type:complete len:93 (-) Transcript_72512:193-471(-)
MQLLCDVLVGFSSLALVSRVGGIFPTALGTAFITLFYSSLLSLAKYFLDPFDNEDSGGKHGISINADTILQETNIGIERWRRSAAWLPDTGR